MKFATDAKLTEYLKDEISVHLWLFERDKYILKQDLGTKCWSCSAIFLAEVEKLDTHTDCTIGFNTVVSTAI